MKCPHCAAEAASNALFCHLCGNPLSHPPNVPSLHPGSAFPSRVGSMTPLSFPGIPTSSAGTSVAGTPWQNPTVEVPPPPALHSTASSVATPPPIMVGPTMVCPHCRNTLERGVGYCFMCCKPISVGMDDPPDFGSDFQSLCLLGQGGMGKIYVVRDRAGREAVLKTMLDPGLVDRFGREAQSIAKLNHPNIVTMYLFRPDPPGPYLVMEFCRQGTLNHLIKRQGRACDELWFFTVMPLLLEALAHSHLNGLVHRDISPDNIFLQNDQPKLGDFGLASDLDRTQLTRTGHFVGKLHYAAPEQWQDAKHVDIRADLFSLGMTMYYAMTLRSPFPVLELNALPPNARLVIEALTAADPADRPESPFEAIALLRKRSQRRTTQVLRKSTPTRPIKLVPAECPECGFDVSDTTSEAPFCAQCGLSQYRSCAGCNKPLRIGMSFCKHCGLNVGALDQVDAELKEAVALADEGLIKEARASLLELSRQQHPTEGKAGDAMKRLVLKVRFWNEVVEEVWREEWNIPALRKLYEVLSPQYPTSKFLEKLRDDLKEQESLRIPGFLFVCRESFHCYNDVLGECVQRVSVFRHVAIAQALGLGPNERAPDVEFVLLPAEGNSPLFTMGAPANEEGTKSYQEQPHPVRLTRSFLVARTPVTWRVWEAMGGPLPVTDIDPMAPATDMFWSEAQEWCQPQDLRLLSEAEWEYACRGGTRTAYCFGSHLASHQACFNAMGPSPVAKFPPNAYGLFDMHGNVWELTADMYERDYSMCPSDGSPHSGDGVHRVVRGGSWASPAINCRSAQRLRNGKSQRSDQIGFRLAKSVGPIENQSK